MIQDTWYLYEAVFLSRGREESCYWVVRFREPLKCSTWRKRREQQDSRLLASSVCDELIESTLLLISQEDAAVYHRAPLEEVPYTDHDTKRRSSMRNSYWYRYQADVVYHQTPLHIQWPVRLVNPLAPGKPWKACLQQQNDRLHAQLVYDTRLHSSLMPISFREVLAEPMKHPEEIPYSDEGETHAH